MNIYSYLYIYIFEFCSASPFIYLCISEDLGVLIGVYTYSFIECFAVVSVFTQLLWKLFPRE